MKIAIDLTALSYHLTGIERFALCMTEAMLNEDAENQFILIFRNEIYPSLNKYIDGEKVKSKIITGNNKLLFFQIILPIELYKIKADKYLFMAFPGPILFFNSNIYNTIHDMGRWDCPETKGVHLFYFKTTESMAIRKAKHLFTVSEFSKSRIHELMGIDNSKITVTYNGVSKTIDGVDSDYETVREKYGLPSQYIMFLSTLQPRKNLKLLIEAFSEIKENVSYDLVLIGRVGWKVEDILEKYGVDGRIHFTGFVEDKDVALIYKNAICFVFPTLYEGFGIPPIEALAMGTPVISSDSSCMREVLRNQAVFFANNDKEDLKEKLISLKEGTEGMATKLDEFQKSNFDYRISAKKCLTKLAEEK